jgi:hypothetical protein
LIKLITNERNERRDDEDTYGFIQYYDNKVHAQIINDYNKTYFMSRCLLLKPAAYTDRRFNDHVGFPAHAYPLNYFNYNYIHICNVYYFFYF